MVRKRWINKIGKRDLLTLKLKGILKQMKYWNVKNNKCYTNDCDKKYKQKF